MMLNIPQQKVGDYLTQPTWPGEGFPPSDGDGRLPARQQNDNAR